MLPHLSAGAIIPRVKVILKRIGQEGKRPRKSIQRSKSNPTERLNFF